MCSRNLLIVFLVLLCGPRGSSAQRVELPISPRIDTTEAHVGDIYRLWRAYLNALPESVRESPYWSEIEQNELGDFDLSRRWLYGYTIPGVGNLHETFDIRPRLLSIEPEGDGYAIRTLYAPDDLEGFQGLYSIQRVYAKREDDAYRLFNALPEATREWSRRRVNLIEYIFPPEHRFDESRATAAAVFADSIRSAFDLKLNESIEYYVAPSVSEMARILGLEFSWDANDGRCYAENRQVFVGNGREDYLHELVHCLFGARNLTPFIDEGLATLLGGIGDRSFSAVAAESALALKEAPNVTFEDAVRGRTSVPHLYYVTGAVVVELVLEEGGANALEEFFEYADSVDGVLVGLEKVVGIAPDDINQLWRERILAHAES